MTDSKKNRRKKKPLSSSSRRTTWFVKCWRRPKRPFLPELKTLKSKDNKKDKRFSTSEPNKFKAWKRSFTESFPSKGLVLLCPCLGRC